MNVNDVNDDRCCLCKLIKNKATAINDTFLLITFNI